MQRLTSAIYGCSGLELTDWEASFFKEQRPFGYIVFGRNIETPAQVKELTAALREASGDPDAPVFVDQEGGSVARFKGPHFRHPPAPRRFMELADTSLELAAEASWLNARLMAEELKELGVNANCAPMLDVVQPTAHEFLRERALGSDPETVATLGRAISVAFRDGGVAPCIKHAPGHGRAMADSHHNLPTVDAAQTDLEQEDFAPFRALLKEPMLMTAHVIYDNLDPKAPATQSSRIIRGLIREEWGYNGLILTDDINMNALDGSIEERSRRALDAGCEIICHCNGEQADMDEVAAAAIELRGDTLERALRARNAANKTPKPFDRPSAEGRLRELGLYEAQK
ncbi:beta-N-acetylhexosaminidase [Parvularcula sp. ZS-1/3]|uniref:beta-N-acetylhexosaminidase n=1 Tax=Parvularcula mediterranea TaxID=2732508 RepID=A0A7Y3RIK6_9PROT|nr:beta-N-acetylhexosaminidase [Parvularcula mediterranea]NNU14718.1 beta-N-acetylhexosaminidase [Parvularcula mediterranea]